ncbi:MAG: hypothetical protein JKY88_19265 [Pseudomonadales bacterium]|nr:hypothetical protein [Pseudomonadales bacterium]
MFNSVTFDDFKFDSSLTEGETRKRHRNLSIATLLAIIVHLFLFFYWRFEVTQANNSVVIKVELVPEEVMLKEEPAPFIQPKYIEKPLVRIIEEIVTLDNMDKLPETAKEKKQHPDTTLYTRAIRAIKDNTLPQPAIFNSFSVADFPQKEIKGLYDRISYLSPIITAPKRIRFRNNDGTYTIKKDDGFGNVTCMEQRGPTDPFEMLNPQLWYLIPNDTCQHIK